MSQNPLRPGVGNQLRGAHPHRPDVRFRGKPTGEIVTGTIKASRIVSRTSSGWIPLFVPFLV